jgi:hypothetical protein
MTAAGATPRETGAAIARRLKAQPISPEQASRVAQLVMAGVAAQKRSERDKCPEGMRQPGDEGSS